MLGKLLSGLGFLALLVAAIIGGQIGRGVGKTAFSSQSRPQEIERELIKGLTQGVEQSNRLGSRMVDPDTRLDTSTVGPGARVTYYYSLLKHSSHDITGAWMDANVRPIVRNGVCTNKDMGPSLQYGATYVFVYRGYDGAEIARFTFDRRDCGLSSAV